QHAGPARTSNVSGIQAGGQSVRYGDDSTGRSKARVSRRDRVSSSDLSLSEVPTVRLGNRQIRQLVDSRGIVGRVVGSVGLTATGDSSCIGDAGGRVVGDGDLESDGRITQASSQLSLHDALPISQHAGPARTSNVSGI